jgi:hypothetical protein
MACEIPGSKARILPELGGILANCVARRATYPLCPLSIRNLWRAGPALAHDRGFVDTLG